MRLTLGGGIRAAESAMRAVQRETPALRLRDRGPRRRSWELPHATLPDLLGITVASNRSYRMTSVAWERPRPTGRSPRDAERDRLQKAFYAAYLAAGKRAYAAPPGRLTARERLILLVGAFEADIENGGFRQYLDNKGRRGAKAALVALTRIGARRTAGLLEQAMQPGVPDRELNRLDVRYAAGREDLAALAMRWVALPTGRPAPDS